MSAFALDTALAQRQEQSLYRQRQLVDGPQNPELVVNGRQYLAFCSNDYLGMAHHPKVINTFKKAADVYGVGGGASHLIVGHSRAHHQLEEELAEFTGRSRALLFSTGYMANLGVVSALMGSGDAVFQDRLNHASLLDAGRLSGARCQRYSHVDCDNLSLRLARSSAKRKLIVTDGVFSMDGNVAPLQALAALAKQHDAWLMVDDAHGFGCIGHGGRGCADYCDLSQDNLPILMGTLSKAFGTAGAFVAGSESLIETLIQFARTYIYTTAMPPAIAEATRTSLRLVQEESWRRTHLTKLINRFRAGCGASDIPLTSSFTAIQPIMVGSADCALAMSHALSEAGILVTAIRPPSVPRGSARLRVTLSAAHTLEQVDRLLVALEQVTRKIPRVAL
ncbi:MAG: 8-amino-7-oxononanoate synthase [Endozoicomonadaceae bacterium]|nr:8-amino-7-oxononanoate synthase [Endozoicomonadaceae bacterium]